MDKLNEIEIGYIAGFVDGEGCVGIHKRKHKNKFGQWIGYSGILQISNTNKEVMEWLKKKCGVSSEIYYKHPKGNRKAAYGISFNKSESYSLLKIILSHLIVKKQQAEIFLLFCENSKDKEIREACFQKLKILNKRGSVEVQRL